MLTFGEQFARAYLSTAQLAEHRRQFDARMAFEAERAAVADEQFGLQFDQSARQFDEQMAFNQNRAAVEDVRYRTDRDDRLAQQRRENAFAEMGFQLQRDQMAMQAEQFGVNTEIARFNAQTGRIQAEAYRDQVGLHGGRIRLPGDTFRRLAAELPEDDPRRTSLLQTAENSDMSMLNQQAQLGESFRMLNELDTNALYAAGDRIASLPFTVEVDQDVQEIDPFSVNIYGRSAPPQNRTVRKRVEVPNEELSNEIRGAVSALAPIARATIGSGEYARELSGDARLVAAGQLITSIVSKLGGEQGLKGFRENPFVKTLDPSDVQAVSTLYKLMNPAEEGHFGEAIRAADMIGRTAVNFSQHILNQYVDAGIAVPDGQGSFRPGPEATAEQAAEVYKILDQLQAGQTNLFRSGTMRSRSDNFSPIGNR